MEENQLLRYRLKDFNLIAIDTETENLNLIFNFPWEVSWLFNEEPIQCFPFKENLKVSNDAARITGFNYLDYKDKAVEPIKVVQKLEEVLYNPKNLIIWQNGLRFDFYLLKILFEYCGKKLDFSFLKRSIDTKCLGAAAYLNSQPSDPIGTNGFLAWQYSMSNKLPDRKMKTSLGVLCKQADIQVNTTQQHIGSYDVFLTRQLFLQQIWKLNLFVA